MKTTLKRILGIIFILIMGYQQLCYADEVIDSNPIPIYCLLGIIGAIISIVAAISYFSLKVAVKKQNAPEYDSEKYVKLTPEEIEKSGNKAKMGLYVGGIILSMAILPTLVYYYYIPEYAFIIPMVFFLISIIVRIFKNKKASNLIYGITLVAVIVICIIGGLRYCSKMIADSFNNQFLDYILIDNLYGDSGYTGYGYNVEDLINAVINNNTNNNRKVVIIYKNQNYTSPDELKQLLSVLNPDKRYATKMKYDNNYLKSIELSTYVQGKMIDPEEYEGITKNGNDIVRLIDKIIYDAYDYPVKTNIIYISETDQKTIITLDKKEDKQQVKENAAVLKKEIGNKKYYNVELITDDYDTLNVIITPAK